MRTPVYKELIRLLGRMMEKRFRQYFTVDLQKERSATEVMYQE